LISDLDAYESPRREALKEVKPKRMGWGIRSRRHLEHLPDVEVLQKQMGYGGGASGLGHSGGQRARLTVDLAIPQTPAALRRAWET